MDTINSVIKWADFPEVVVSSRGHREGVILDEQRVTHSSYASNERYVRDLGLLVKICTITGVVLFGIESYAFAEVIDGSIDAKGRELYYGPFISIATGIIAFKGGWDTLHKVLKEDFEGAKRSFLQYLIAFAGLLSLPKALEYVEKLFTQ